MRACVCACGKQVIYYDYLVAFRPALGEHRAEGAVEDDACLQLLLGPVDGADGTLDPVMRYFSRVATESASPADATGSGTAPVQQSPAPVALDLEKQEEMYLLYALVRTGVSMVLVGVSGGDTQSFLLRMVAYAHLGLRLNDSISAVLARLDQFTNATAAAERGAKAEHLAASATAPSDATAAGMTLDTGTVLHGLPVACGVDVLGLLEDVFRAVDEPLVKQYCDARSGRARSQSLAKSRIRFPVKPLCAPFKGLKMEMEMDKEGFRLYKLGAPQRGEIGTKEGGASGDGADGGPDNARGAVANGGGGECIKHFPLSSILEFHHHAKARTFAFLSTAGS